MLIRSDILPLPGQGTYCIDGKGAHTAREAVIAMDAGKAVTCADEATAEGLADRLDDVGNDVRAAMIRRVHSLAQEPPPEPTPEPEPEAPQDQTAEPTPEPEAPSEPEPGPTLEAQAEEAHVLLKAAGEDVLALRALCLRVDVEADSRWKAKRLITEITSQIARNLSEGKPALQ